VVNRPALTRERIVEAAVRVADRGGVAQISMRNVGKELGVEAMSLYHHVPGKDALLDGIADWIFAQMDVPAAHTPWRQAMVDRAQSARQTVSQHPWALGLIESRRAPLPALLQHHNAVLACLRTNGFSIELAAHAFSAIDSYVYGFALTEVNLPFGESSGAEEMAREMQDALPDGDYPFLIELLTEHVVGKNYDYGDEFTYGLDLILDSLERQFLGH
jgi:AcrR family transcriptional regulator